MSGKRQSMKRQSKAGGGKRQSMKRQSKAGGQRQSMQRKSSKGGPRKSMGGGKGKKSLGGQKTIGNPMARRGRDKFTYPNGDKYEGDWLAVYPDIFVRDGEGTYTCSDGTTYFGLWELDRLETGSITWPCGQKYSGDFKDQKMYGIGTYTFPGRGELSGSFVDNNPEGNVVFLDMAGMKYVGRIDPNAQTARMKMLNHLVGGFTKDDLVLPQPPKGVDEDDDPAAKEKKDSKAGSRRASRKSKQSRKSQSGQKRQSKSKSTTGKRQSMKKRQSSVKKK